MIIGRSDLHKVLQKLKGKKIVTTNGAFDLFHYGHLKSLVFAKELGDILIVGINSDASIKSFKPGRPIIPQRQRAEIVAALACVDYVVLFDEKDPIKLLEEIKPCVHVKGSEYRADIIEKETVEKNGGRIVFIERDPEDVSTTQIIKKIMRSK